MTILHQSTEKFCDALEYLSTDAARIYYMKTLHSGGYHFHLEEQPEALLMRFIDTSINASPGQMAAAPHWYMGTTPTSPVSEVAQVFVECFPAPYICQKLSQTHGKTITLMNALPYLLKQYTDPADIQRVIDLCKAFADMETDQERLARKPLTGGGCKHGRIGAMETNCI